MTYETTTYRATGRLTHPVNDLQAARDYLREHSEGMEDYIHPESLRRPVHTVRWDLRGVASGVYVIRVQTGAEVRTRDGDTPAHG